MTFTFSFDEEKQETEYEEREGKEARQHTLEEIVQALPVTISLSTIKIGATTLPRRELWDIKHQIMTQTDDSVLEYMAADDVIHGIYEGGFKTWECSIDLAAHLDTLPQSFCELGCGSAMPSLILFKKALQENKSVCIILQDYNVEVLQYSTIPNFYLVWAGAVAEDVTVDENAFLEDLKRRNIEIICISGSWSQAMADMISVDLILASETIYSPHYLKSLITVLHKAKRSLIAAKTIYFGVGGGVNEFIALLPTQMTHRTVHTTTTGVQRIILEIERV